MLAHATNGRKLLVFYLAAYPDNLMVINLFTPYTIYICSSWIYK